jgi:hypothetical protein
MAGISCFIERKAPRRFTEHGVELLGVELGERRLAASATPRVVEGGVQAAERADGRLDEAADRPLVGNVGGNRDRPSATALDLVGDLLQGVGVARGEGHRRAGVGERAGGGRPDPAARAGHDRYLAGEQRRLRRRWVSCGRCGRHFVPPSARV